MEYAILSTVLGLSFFIVPVFFYRKGLQDGLNISQGKPIQQITNPITAVNNLINERKTKQDVNEFIEGFNNMMMYNGKPQEVKTEDGNR